MLNSGAKKAADAIIHQQHCLERLSHRSPETQTRCLEGDVKFHNKHLVTHPLETQTRCLEGDVKFHNKHSVTHSRENRPVRALRSSYEGAALLPPPTRPYVSFAWNSAFNIQITGP